MVKAFDGFIAAVSAEMNIPFHKEKDGEYSSDIEFEGGRHQKVRVTLGKDDSGDPTINYYSNICKLTEELSTNLKLLTDSLKMNAILTYGAVAISKNDLIIHQTYYLKDMDPIRFVKSLLYVAARADELEENIVHVDVE